MAHALPQVLNSIIAGPSAGWLHQLFLFMVDPSPIFEIHVDPNRTVIPGSSQFVTFSRLNGTRLLLVSLVNEFFIADCVFMCRIVFCNFYNLSGNHSV
jgi:hypothetical protein